MFDYELKGEWIDADKAAFEAFKSNTDKMPELNAETLPAIRPAVAEGMAPQAED